MQGFIDEVRITVSSGDGGAGSVSFRREKYVERGGPDGGDGGRGGDLVFRVRNNLKTLTHLRANRAYCGEAGFNGKGRRKHGKDGAPQIIDVPPGTMIKDFNTGEVIYDFFEPGEVVFLKGGRGGQGNWHFRSAKRQTPRFAQPGMPGEEREIVIELNIMADIGFVGFPNAGKSSLLTALTNATPQVASYPFTTKIPNLGMLRRGDKDVVLADIPGIIEGASEGAGLGFRFLKHISRTSGLAYLIDVSENEPEKVLETLKKELRDFSESLAQKKYIIIATKSDLDEDGDLIEDLRKRVPQEKIFSVSVFSREGLDSLSEAFLEMTEE